MGDFLKHQEVLGRLCKQVGKQERVPATEENLSAEQEVHIRHHLENGLFSLSPQVASAEHCAPTVR